MVFRRFLVSALSASFLGLSACASDPRSNFENPVRLATLSQKALGGEALAQRKLELERALSDMDDFLETLVSMEERRDEHGIEQFRAFLDQYLLTHLEPLLAPAWQSHHPELIKLDANLRFIQTELLIQLSYKRWASDVIDDLRARYKERGNMLIEYPTGTQTTLREALAKLRERAWRT